MSASARWRAAEFFDAYTASHLNVILPTMEYQECRRIGLRQAAD
jgi:hypothetical protein